MPPLPDAVVDVAVADAAGQIVARYHLIDDGEFIVGRDRETAHLIIDDKSVSRRHALLRRAGETLAIADAGSLNGTGLGDGSAVRLTPASDDGSPCWIDWPPGLTATIGIFTLRWSVLPPGGGQHGPADEALITSIGSDRSAGSSLDAAASDAEFEDGHDDPALLLGGTEIVALADVRARAETRGIPIEERDYLAIGGGLGSFAWVDHLRIFGVAADAVRIVGIHAEPTARWADYCANSQLPAGERIRSNSASAPDNIWGFPGYALRETWQRLGKGRLDALLPLWRVFGEPLFTETYTPTVGHVRTSVARECRRIDWARMFAYGRAVALRKTDDGRFVLAYRVPFERGGDNQARDRLCIARHVHIATGYPAIRILPLLQAFRRKHPSVTTVVNAYEAHEEIYRRLEIAGGTVIVEGRGIVASRVLQRLLSLRQRHAGIEIIHLMRYPILHGHAYDRSRRGVRDHVETQPFNWPKALWGGTLRRRLESAGLSERSHLMDVWGGTTTADRRDWRQALDAAKAAGWYRPVFGDLVGLRTVDDRLAATLAPPGHASGEAPVALSADYLIDCIGLVADVTAAPFLADLLDTYALPRNRAAGTGAERGMSGLRVSPAFEIVGLRNGSGRVYASGIVTANGAYAPVDSFLGLGFAALRSVEALADARSPGLDPIGPARSFAGWLKWCRGVTP